MEPSNMPLRFLLGVKQPGEPNRIVVWDTEEVSIGRAPENDLVIDDDGASRRHALLRRSPSGHRAIDLGTANGTLVNGEPIDGERTLEVRDVIEIGTTQITFISTRKDPSASGMEVVHASQLKGFHTPTSNTRPDATMMSISELDDDGPGQQFQVGALGSFDAARDAAGSNQPEAAGGRVSLQLEIDGLSPDLRRLLGSFLGKSLELPPLRIRIVDDDIT